MRRLIAALLLFGYSSLAAAGVAEDVWEAYLLGDFDRVGNLVKTAAADMTISDSELARCYLALGCAEAMQSKNKSSITAFERALTLNPDMEVSQGELPPPVWEIFKPVRDRMPFNKNNSLVEIPVLKANSEDSLKQFPVEKSQIDTLIVEIPTSISQSSAWKSLVYPGWGHLSEGNARWYIFAGIETAMISGLVISSVLANKARSDYLRESDPRKFDSEYRTYNTYYKLSIGFGTAAIVNYALTQWDFFTHPPEIGLNNSNGVTSARFRYRF